MTTASTFPALPTVVILPYGLQPELGEFARRLCVAPPTFCPVNGLGVVATVEGGDAATLEHGAEVIAAWKTDARARLSHYLEGGPRLPINAGAELSAALDAIARDHWQATDGAGRWARKFNAPRARTVNAA